MNIFCVYTECREIYKNTVYQFDNELNWRLMRRSRKQSNKITFDCQLLPCLCFVSTTLFPPLSFSRFSRYTTDEILIPYCTRTPLFHYQFRIPKRTILIIEYSNNRTTPAMNKIPFIILKFQRTPSSRYNTVKKVLLDGDIAYVSRC